MPADFATYWQSIVSANPDIADEDGKLTISVKALRNALERAYNHGESDGRSLQKAASKLEKLSERQSSPFGDIFSGMFGSKDASK